MMTIRLHLKCCLDLASAVVCAVLCGKTHHRDVWIFDLTMTGGSTASRFFCKLHAF